MKKTRQQGLISMDGCAAGGDYHSDIELCLRIAIVCMLSSSSAPSISILHDLDKFTL
ncbi:hypothetical protein ACQKKK_07400 [Peribacillus sp. NPDC006672]|uniref:hypothetical protein n=1 Tax=Peribacillus sp. NPDC006672 TaxID=3390606 RepID=UPI003D05F91B